MTGRSRPPPAFGNGAPRILVVDDEPAIRRMLARVLESIGYVVVPADSAHAALRAFLSEAPIALAIVDLTLPDGDGYSLVSSIRAELGDRAPPFIIVSGRCDPRTPPDGCLAVLLKPFPLPRLLAIVRAAIDTDPFGKAESASKNGEAIDSTRSVRGFTPRSE